MAAHDGAVYGPVDASAVLAWIANGIVQPDTLLSGGMSAEWLQAAEHPDFAHLFTGKVTVTPTPVRPRRRTFISIVAAVVAIALLTVTLFAGLPLTRSGPWGLLPDMIGSALRGDWGGLLDPQTPLASDGDVFRKELLAGIRIDAPTSALDYDRTFSARELDAAEMSAAARSLSKQGLTALGGYSIDAGMVDSDVIHKPAVISFDLEKLGIPKDLWPDIGIASISPDGTASLVNSRLDGSILRIETRRNGSWLPVLVPMLTA